MSKQRRQRKFELGSRSKRTQLGRAVAEVEEQLDAMREPMTRLLAQETGREKVRKLIERQPLADIKRLIELVEKFQTETRWGEL